MAARPVPAAPTARADEECAALYRRYGGEILRYCRGKLGERADAEDVTQQVYVRAYGALLRGERVRLPRHWLLRIARNECRRFAARRRRVEEVEFDEAIDVVPVDEGARWSPAEIRRALDALVPAQRQALVLRELEGRPYAEIARELRVTVSAVETLLFRARRSLREQLDGALACDAAEQALSLELDGRLPEAEKPGLRAHLRSCADCRRLARRHRARRHALRTLLPFPLQGQLASLGGGAAGGAAVGTGAVAKALALLAAAGAASTTVGLTAARPADAPERAPTNAAVAAQDPGTPTVRAQAVPTARPRARATPVVASSAPASAPVAGTTPATAATTTVAVTTAPAAAPGVAPAAPAAEQQPLTAVVSTVEETVGTLEDTVGAVEDTVDTLVPTLPLPEPKLPPIQPPPLPVEPPPLPTVPELPPLDPDLPG